jgi:HSP20 family protein
MENKMQYNNSYSIYPGDYVPTIQIKDVEEELAHVHTKEYVEMNMKELKDSYVVEVAIPGVKNENFLIESNENILSIRMLHRECNDVEGENFILHKLNCRCFDRKVILPKNVDTEFIDAEYKAGILRLHVPKAKKLSNNQHTRIVVY